MPLSVWGMIISLIVGLVIFVMTLRNMKGMFTTASSDFTMDDSKIMEGFSKHFTYIAAAAGCGVVFAISLIIFIVRDVLKF